MLHTGAFHTEFRAAVARRGLSLARIRERLADQGVPVSVSTLSNWQRGASRPAGGDARRVLSALEDLLRVEAGGLCGLLDDGPATGRWRELGPGTSARRIKELRARLDPEDHSDLTMLSATDEALVDIRTQRIRTRLVLRAGRDGADRHIVFAHASRGHLPSIHSTVGCTVGRTAEDAESGLSGAELRFPPLAAGETFPIEYTSEWVASDPYYGRWIRTAGLRYELSVRFRPEVEAGSAHRVWRLDALTPHKDVAEVRLIGGELAHMIEEDPNPGFHGIRWE